MAPLECHSIFFIFILLLSTSSFTTGSDPAANALVDKVCNQTSNYTFCVGSLYSDPRTPDADRYTLAYISVGLAYGKATATRDNVAELLKNIDPGHPDYRHSLQRCAGNYDKAVSLLVVAQNDLNSESFSELPVLARNVSCEANRCEAVKFFIKY
ncbi:C, putative [Ricinus communis]|uniref:C, putative n=1 Tax=Ricinus communis TaxID=3988 RepID=B9RVI9_RICCO|nr:C, putative [Ricinus communis]